MNGVLEASGDRSNGKDTSSQNEETSIPSVMISLEAANQLRHELAMSPEDPVEMQLHAPRQGGSIESSSPSADADFSGDPVVTLLENSMQVKGIGEWGVEVSSDASKRKWQLSIIQDSE